MALEQESAEPRPPSRRKRIRLWLEFRSEAQLRSWLAMMHMDEHLPLTANIQQLPPVVGEDRRDMELRDFL